MAAILKTSPLKTLFDSSQLSGSINVQDGGTTSFLKTIHASRSKIRLLCRLLQLAFTERVVPATQAFDWSLDNRCLLALTTG